MSSFCDSRCTGASGKSCDCECGGTNHGGRKAGKTLKAIDRSHNPNPNNMKADDIDEELSALTAQAERANEPGLFSEAEKDKELESIDDRRDQLEFEQDRRSGKDKVREARAAMSGEKVLKPSDVQKLEDEFYDLKGVIEDDTQSVKVHREAANKMHGLRFRIVGAYNEKYDSKETYERISSLTSESARLIEEEGI